jgi:PAS domain S-box-containing protein
MTKTNNPAEIPGHSQPPEKSLKGVPRDTTVRKETERALMDTEARLSAFMDCATDSFYLLDSDLNFIEINKRGLEIIGKKRDDVIGKNIDEIVPDVRNSGRREKHLEVMRTGEPYIIEHFVPHPVFGDRHFVLTSFKVGSGLGVIAHDITERVKAEEALRASEELLNVVYNNTFDQQLLISVDPDGAFRVLKVNDTNIKTLHTMGLDVTENDLIGKTVEEVLCGVFGMDQELLKNTLNYFRQAITSGKPVNHEESVQQGKIQYYSEVTIVPVSDSKGTCIYVLYTSHNITERKRAEEAQKESEVKFEMTFRSAPYAMCITLPSNGKIIDANDKYIRLIGYSAEELLSSSTKELNIWADPVQRDKLVAELYNNGQLRDVECVFRRKSGETFTALLSADILNLHGNQYILSSTIDTTERKQAEKALAESEKKYRTLVDSASEAILVAQDGMLKFVNHKTEDLAGYSEPELLAKPFPDFIYPDDRQMVVENYTKRIKGVPVLPQYEFRLLCKDGSARWVEINSVLIDWKDKPATLNFLTDITERKRLEEERQKLDQQLMQAQKLDSLGVLAGGIAHDFNNLLGGIFGYIDLASSESDGEKTTGYLSKALTTIDRARGLTQQLLTFAKGGAPARATHRLPQLIKETGQFALSGSNVSCIFDIPDDLWPCDIDKNQIGQAIDNIVINAQQAMPLGGSLRISAANVSFAENEHAPLAKGDYVRLSFKDTGVGIPKDILPRIFDPFFTTKTKGHGLGLATCYSIVKRHYGVVEVESVPGEGSTFQIYLPASPTSTGKAEKTSGSRHRGSGIVLLMDDEEVIRDTVGDMLKKLGYSVVFAANGTEALRLIAEQEKSGKPFVAFFLDLTIPGGLGGRETLLEIRSRGSHVPAFVISGYAEDPVMAQPQDHDFTASICKPFKKSDLAELLEKYMGKG